MLPRIALLAAGLCVVSVLAAGRAPDVLNRLIPSSTAVVVDSPPAAGEPGAAPRERQTTLRKGSGGHVILDASVNGRSVPMMVDTGASLVAFSFESARQLGIDPPRSEYRIALSTANGVVRAAPVRLRQIRIGDIAVSDVDAVVLPAGAMNGNLLGMSFLNRLRRFEFRGNELVLTQ